MPDKIRINPSQSPGVPRSTFGRSLFQTPVNSARRVPGWPGVLFATSLAVIPLVVTAASGPKRSAELTSAPIQVFNESGRYVIEYDTGPDPIPTNEMFEMLVMVHERLNKGPAEYVTLEVDAGMPGHGDGMNTLPVVKGSPPDGIQAHGMCLHMAGDWELTFTVRRGIMLDRGVVQVNLK